MEWIKNSIIGDITKDMLDQQRISESNQNDLMQNTSTIYHIESIIEMQLICLTCSIMFGKGFKSVQYEDNSEIHRILNYLMFDHVFAYLSDYFRKWEIARYG